MKINDVPFWVCAWCAQPVIQVELVSRILKIMRIGLLDRKPIWINFMILLYRNFFLLVNLIKTMAGGDYKFIILKFCFRYTQFISPIWFRLQWYVTWYVFYNIALKKYWSCSRKSLPNPTVFEYPLQLSLIDLVLSDLRQINHQKSKSLEGYKKF